MLDKEVFKENMNKLMYLFKNWNFDPSDPNEARAWYEMFKHFDNSRFECMVEKYIDNEKFPPTVAGLKAWDIAPRKTMDQIKHEQYMEQMEKEREKEKINAGA